MLQAHCVLRFCCQFGSLCFTSGNTQIQARAKKGRGLQGQAESQPSRSTERASFEREREALRGGSLTSGFAGCARQGPMRAGLVPRSFTAFRRGG